MDTQTEPVFQNNADKKQFELVVEGQTARIEYSIANNIYILTHTEVPAALEGKSVGKTLVQKAFAWLEEHNHKIVPLCPFIIAYLKRNPEWNRLVHH